MEKYRDGLLGNWAQYLADAAGSGALTGKPCPISLIETIAGPRAGALEIFAGLEAGRLLRALSKNDCAALRQFVPWSFAGQPQIFMSGRYVRVEAGWPSELAENDIPLSSLPPYPHGKGRWVVGRNEYGQTVAAGVNLDMTPHWLISGATGAGKTVALRSALMQLASDSENRLVVVDGKRGASFGGQGLRQMAGPLATTPDDWRRALVWAVREMMRRYENDDHDGRLIVCVDEVQEVIQADPAAAEAIRRLVVLGRDAGTHSILATQHPIIAALGGPTVTRNLVGRLALRVADSTASQVAIGGNEPRADCLLGHGDAYAVTPTTTHRVQVAYTTDKDMARVTGPPMMEEWPEADAEALGQSPQSGRPSPWPAPAEMGAAMTAAGLGRGRPWLKDAIEGDGMGRPGSDRARRLLALGRDTLDWLNEHGWRLGAEARVITVS